MSGPPGPGTPLPCLSSDNCDKPRSALTSADRKRAQSVQLNINHFVSAFGLPNVGMLTITFADDLDTREAQRRVHNFWRRECSEMFGEYVRVREFTKRGRPHFHFAIQCHGDIRSGFDFEHHRAVQLWNKTGRKGPKPKGFLNRTALLSELHRRLNEKGPAYGIGRMELTPVVSETGVGFYLGGYLAKSIGNKPADAKRTRSVTYSQGYARKVKGAWSWANPAAWLWRAKLRTWAAGHGCTSMRDVAVLFGPRWAYHCRDAILAVKLAYYPTAEHAKLDGVSMPLDAVHITVTRPVSPPLLRVCSVFCTCSSLQQNGHSGREANQFCDHGSEGLQFGEEGACGFTSGLHCEGGAVSTPAAVNAVPSPLPVARAGFEPPVLAEFEPATSPIAERSEPLRQQSPEWAEPPRTCLPGQEGPSEIQPTHAGGDKPAGTVRRYFLGNRTLIPRLHLQPRLRL